MLSNCAWQNNSISGQGLQMFSLSNLLRFNNILRGLVAGGGHAPPPTHSTPKSSTIKKNFMGRQVCLHSPGVVAASNYPDLKRCVRSKLLASLPL